MNSKIQQGALNKFLEQTPIQRVVYVSLGALFHVVELTFIRYKEFASITFVLLSRFELAGHRNYVIGRNRTLCPSSPAIITYLRQYDPQMAQCSKTAFALFFLSSRIGHLGLV